MTIDEFREVIQQIKPNNSMGMNGAGSGILGSPTGADIITQLQQATIEFAQAYKTTDDPAKLKEARRAVTANIMVAATVDAISETLADKLVDMLREVMKGKK